MEKFEISALFDHDENIIHRPRISYKVRYYVWNYIYENILVNKKIMTRDKFKYDICLGLKKFNPEIHKYHSDSMYNDDNNKFRH